LSKNNNKNKKGSFKGKGKASHLESQANKFRNQSYTKYRTKTTTADQTILVIDKNRGITLRHTMVIAITIIMIKRTKCKNKPKTASQKIKECCA